jgi:hypothetical protein
MAAKAAKKEAEMPRSIAEGAAITAGKVAQGTVKSWFDTFRYPFTTLKNLKARLFDNDGGYTPEALAQMKAEASKKAAAKKGKTEL